jgi:hypothetical protein
MVVHHTGKSGDLDGRGSSAQVNAIRFELFLEQKKDLEVPGMGKIIELTTGKNNIGLAVYKDFYFRLHLAETPLTINGLPYQKRIIPRFTYEHDWKNTCKARDNSQLSLIDLQLYIKDKGNRMTGLELIKAMIDTGYEKNASKHTSKRKQLLESGVLMELEKKGKACWYCLTAETLIQMEASDKVSKDLMDKSSDLDLE